MTDVERICNISAEEVSSQLVNITLKWAIAIVLLLSRKMHKSDLIIKNFDHWSAELNKIQD